MGVEISPRQQCPGCQAVGSDTSKDNLATYADGQVCMKPCGYVNKNNNAPTKDTKAKAPSPLIPGVFTALDERGLTKETCEKYRVRTADTATGSVRILPYHKDGRVVRQKIKSRTDKSIMYQKGDTTSTQMFGQQLFSPSKRIPVAVCEGEEDSMAIWQMTGLPAVSIINGAGSALKDMQNNLEWLSGFREVLICFDNDDPGQDAFKKVVGLFEPGTVKRVSFSLKDANEMLLAGRTEEVKKCLWNGEIVKPNTIVFPHEIREKILTQPTYGRPWPWRSMTKATYGMRLGETYMCAGATSQGKTELIKDIVSDLLADDCKVGVFSFEQTPTQTMQRYIGARLNQRIHLPGCVGWDEQKIVTELDHFGDRIALYEPESGNVTVESILINIRFLTKAHKMTFFVIDNLKALSTNPIIDGKRVAVHDYASYACSQFVAIAKQLNITIFILNHLSADKISLQAYVTTSPKNPEKYNSMDAEGMQGLITKPGMSWERGRTPGIENIFGGGAIKDLMDYILVVSRDRMSKDYEIHRTTKVTFLKTRMDSTYEGYSFDLKYNYNTGRLEEDFSRDLDNRETDTKYNYDDNDTDNVLK